jgi:bis(5'-nucleosidyl)-tetraphosphatase
MPAIDPADKILSAGLIVVHFDESRYRFLVLRSFSAWDFPKALVADGEDPMTTAINATRDITGIDELELNWGDEHRETVADDDGSVSRYYLAQSKTMDVDLRVPGGVGSDEDFEFQWVTAEEAEDVLPPRLAIVLDFALRMLVSSARGSR